MKRQEKKKRWNQPGTHQATALDEENKAIEAAKNNRQSYQLEVFFNDDTLKQLLARSRYLLFKHPTKWTGSQKRVDLLFPKYPLLYPAYNYDLGTHIYHLQSKQQALKRDRIVLLRCLPGPIK